MPSSQSRTPSLAIGPMINRKSSSNRSLLAPQDRLVSAYARARIGQPVKTWFSSSQTRMVAQGELVFQFVGHNAPSSCRQKTGPVAAGFFDGPIAPASDAMIRGPWSRNARLTVGITAPMRTPSVNAIEAVHPTAP